MVLKEDLIRWALEHHCDVHAFQNGELFYEVDYERLMAEGVPEQS